MQSLDDLPELAPYLPEMDDLEEELAAHAAPPAGPGTESSQTEEPAATSARLVDGPADGEEGARSVTDQAVGQVPEIGGEAPDAGTPGGSWSNQDDD